MPKVYPHEFGDAVVRIVLVRGKSSGVTRLTKESRVQGNESRHLSQAKPSPEGVIFNVSESPIRTR